MKEKEKKQENMDVKKHLTPEDDEKLHEAYINALGEILENDDDDARDNLANYMDEVKEESDVLGTEQTRMIWIGERTLDFPLFYSIYRIHPGGFKCLPCDGQRANNDCRYTDKDK